MGFSVFPKTVVSSNMTLQQTLSSNQNGTAVTIPANVTPYVVMFNASSQAVASGYTFAPTTYHTNGQNLFGTIGEIPYNGATNRTIKVYY